MKSRISLPIAAMMLSLIILNLSCASFATVSVPDLANRTLRISPDFAGFEYQYEVCLKEVLWICVRREMRKETFDLNDLETRKMLIAMGFVARVRERP